MLVSRKNLHGDKVEKATLLLQLETDLPYNPGDHLGVFPGNRPEIVDKIVERLDGVENPNEVVQLQTLEENHTPNGNKFLFSSIPKRLRH